MSNSDLRTALIIFLVGGAAMVYLGAKDSPDFEGKFLPRGSADRASLVARWVPNPERGEPDSTLSGGRR